MIGLPILANNKYLIIAKTALSIIPINNSWFCLSYWRYHKLIVAVGLNGWKNKESNIKMINNPTSINNCKSIKGIKPNNW